METKNSSLLCSVEWQSQTFSLQKRSGFETSVMSSIVDIKHIQRLSKNSEKQHLVT